MRQIVLDTETTGIDPKEGHRIIEIGCVELIERRLTGNHFHVYINPEREVEEEALAVHGISNEFLVDKPVFREIAESFLEFIRGAELIIHNAPFDVGFIDHEFALLNDPRFGTVADICTVTDTLVMARHKHPGQRNSLDALCKRYGIDNSHRELHGALLDAEILADVYLAMTGGQTLLSLGGGDEGADDSAAEPIRRLPADRPRLRVIHASEQELAAHEAKLDDIAKAAGKVIWREREA